jgi:hypothetical protein
MKICSTSHSGISFRSTGEISHFAAEWDALLPDNHPLNSRFLRIFEEAALPDLRFHYLLISRDDQIIGLAIFQHFHFHSGHYDSKALGQGPMFYLSQLLLCQETGILVCGNLFHLGQEGFYFPDDSNRSAIFPVALEMEKKYKPGGILLKDISEGFSASALKDSKFRTFSQDQVMSLSIPPAWNSFDDYIGSLSKKYRQRAHRVLKLSSPLRLCELNESELAERREEIGALYAQVRQRQALRIGSLNGDYFLAMKKAHGKKFEVHAWVNEAGQILAFASHILHPGEEREVHYIGFDYSSNEEYSLYFNILFDGIRRGITHGNTKILFGRTGFDAKASAGAVPENNLHYFRLKPGLPALTFKILSKALAKKESENWKNRNPFHSAGLKPELEEA